MTETDDNLVELAKGGDHAAFRQLVERYQRDVLVTVVGILGNSDAVDDVVQDTFIRLHKSLAQFEGRASLKTYLTKIAMNKSLDHLRKEKRRSKREVNLDERSHGNINPVEQDNLADKIVWKAVDSLPEKYKAVVVLRLIDGYSTEEVAQILEIKYGTVLSRLSRATTKMKEYLEPYYTTQALRTDG
ncbi:MAG: RNA polymerase sigma factor [Rhodothermales bacterium]|nr:RNA polymerase sigma factor [Rhodothermales bacterium]